MRRFLSILFAGGMVALSNLPSKADYDSYGISYSGDASIGNYLWGIDTETGSKTLITTKLIKEQVQQSIK